MWSRYPCGDLGRALAAKEENTEYRASQSRSATNERTGKVKGELSW